MHSSGSRTGLVLGIIALALPVLALGAFVSLFALQVPGGQTVNPLATTTFYVNPSSSASQAAAAAAERSGASSAEATALNRLADQPAAIWLTPEKYPLDTVGAEVATITDAAVKKGKTAVFVVYGIPNRDCGNFSAGGLSVLEYPGWVQAIATSLTLREAVVILEPDALSLATQCNNVEERVHEVHTAVDLLAPTRATVYLDAGHSEWIAPSAMAGLLNRSGIASVRGFATNVSNYMDSAAEHTYAQQLSSLTNGAHYVIDTSRNGAGSNGEWCNPPGRALGVLPSVVTNQGAQDANLWIKQPGESDGTCNGGPTAGDWWNAQALALTRAAGW
ncbi:MULTISPECIES: glycoside hydrolase family 6 protein [unclassified Cryobacterium]|uniref:glycoside hydrolase family 6 protein n=1 Tax=unclassified Cryobacterium TaxID=2649013 RepID=UPI002AB3AE8B|nr:MULTISPECIES: glycoside hydrolase family 6 protein [unclassified Cryobacterium]MDY7541574.1 glycoside hydrolase family 6 protein [Cryobacterium sp. 5B3]MEA9998047.1 glycoside hydrolase family 6 protein [Cryobacterium sp. RTS3]MEB0266951.1 glycoside hydrolase family 6 protein [Cryobacterium sp. 10I5]MEB0275354.1 glycoside hydrolase family 6 protein [Cryobacterium sp. 5B3]